MIDQYSSISSTNSPTHQISQLSIEVSSTLQQLVDYQSIYNLQKQFVYAAHVPQYGYFMNRPHTPEPQSIPNANYGFSQPNPIGCSSLDLLFRSHSNQELVIFLFIARIASAVMPVRALKDWITHS